MGVWRPNAWTNFDKIWYTTAKSRPQWQSRDQILHFLNSKWRTTAMLENVGNAITRLPIDLLGLNLGGGIPSCPRYVRLATAHWTFSSYGRLEAERVNQFCWNLVYNSKLGPQWRSLDQILKFLTFKMADGRHVGKYWKYHNAPSNGPNQLGRNLAGRILSCSRHFRHNAVAMATAHWTFSSYGHLEAELVYQFWWNLVYNSKFGQQWQSRDQILKSKTSKILMKLGWLCHCGTKNKIW